MWRPPGPGCYGALRFTRARLSGLVQFPGRNTRQTYIEKFVAYFIEQAYGATSTESVATVADPVLETPAVTIAGVLIAAAVVVGKLSCPLRGRTTH